MAQWNHGQASSRSYVRHAETAVRSTSNRALLEYCTDNHITFTRSRPYLENDTCHIEQKNWAVVRHLVGYDRLEWPALAALERIHDLAGDYVNFLHPVRKLVSKTRSGPRVTRRYDVATTPFHRLLDSGVLSIKMSNELKKRSKTSIRTDSKCSSRPRSAPLPLVPLGRILT